jgi:eukaryotic-like serine/threonine-protein kinase
MAEVYRAKDTRLGRDVAIKVVSEALGGDGAFLERFEREAKLAASVAHPNVVALFDVGLQDGKPYFVTELLQGETLRERLAKGPIPLAKTLEWATQMAQGLAAAHERGIVHRDLKPENAFITRDGQVKLLDFGIAKLVEAAQGATPHGLMDATVSPSGNSTGTGMVLGTPGYMSPEQVRGDPVDARTDFFSLGAVLYEMLCGHRAFPAGAVVESGYAILHSEPDPFPSTVPLLVSQVTHRCLEKEPGRRFQSARDLAFNLELVRTPTGSAGPTATAPGVPATVSRWRRWRWPFAGAVAALALAAWTYTVGRDTRLPTPSVELITTRLGLVSAARFGTNGRVVFSAAWDGQPLELFARAPGSLESQSLGLRDTALLGVSATGELAVALRPGLLGRVLRGTLALVPEAGGKPRELAEDIAWADFSPTGELAVVRISNGKVQLEYPLGRVLYETTLLLGCPRVSPRGDAVVFREGGKIKVVDLTGQVRTLPSTNSPTGLAWTPSGNEVWFTSVGQAGGSAIWATNPLMGTQRLVYQGVSELVLEDIAPDGRVLLSAEDTRWEVAARPAGEQRELRLSVFDSTLAALSDDGQQILFTSREGPVAYLRQTDGTAPLKLGGGEALDLSLDKRWALVRPPVYAGSLSLLPTGSGVPRTLSLGGLHQSGTRLLHDGTGVVVDGLQNGQVRSELYVVPLDGGSPAAISDGGVTPYYLEVSRDDHFVAALALDEILTVYPTDGGPSVPLAELGKNALPVGWTLQGQLWVQLDAQRELPSHVVRYDIQRHQVLEERTIALGDRTGVLQLFNMKLTPDGRALAFSYRRSLGYLYLLEGLVPPPRR